MQIAILDKVHPKIKLSLENKGWYCDNLFEQNRAELISVIKDYDGIT